MDSSVSKTWKKLSSHWQKSRLTQDEVEIVCSKVMDEAHQVRYLFSNSTKHALSRSHHFMSLVFEIMIWVRYINLVASQLWLLDIHRLLLQNTAESSAAELSVSLAQPLRAKRQGQPSSAKSCSATAACTIERICSCCSDLSSPGPLWCHLVIVPIHPIRSLVLVNGQLRFIWILPFNHIDYLIIVADRYRHQRVAKA